MHPSPPDTAVCSPLNCDIDYCYVNEKRPAGVTFPVGRFAAQKGLAPEFYGDFPLWTVENSVDSVENLCYPHCEK